MATHMGPSGTFYRVRIGLALAATGALLAACGSSSKGASTGTSVSTAPSKAASSKSSSGSVSTNLGGGSFCDKAKQASANVSSAADSLATGTPDKIKTFEENALAELKALRDQAPSEIKGAISTLTDAENTLFNDLQSANFDFTKVSSQIATQFSSPQFTDAIKQIQTYLVSKCGIAPSAFPTT